MNMAGRIAAWTCICGMLLSGCYSQVVVTESEPLPDDQAAVFYLKDGSRVEAEPGRHTRIDGGYQVTGTMTKRESAEERFEGAIHDPDIRKVTAEGLNVPRTFFAVTFAAICIVGGTWVYIAATH